MCVSVFEKKLEASNSKLKLQKNLINIHSVYFIAYSKFKIKYVK